MEESHEIQLKQLLWFIRLRWVAVVGGILILLLAPWFAPFEIQFPKLALCLIVLGLLNMGYLVRYRALRTPAEVKPDFLKKITRFFHFQMLGDLALLTLMITFSGGVSNPIFFFYLFHMAISTMVFSPRQSLAYAFLALVLPWALFLLEPFIAGMGGLWKDAPLQEGTQKEALLAAYSVTVFGLWYFLSRLAADLRAKQMALREAGNKLQAANEELKQLDVYKNQFLRQVVFQLKKPAIEMDYELSTVEKSLPKKNETAASAIQTAKKHIWSLLELIDDLVWLSRTQIQEMNIQKEWMDVYEVLLSRVQAVEGEAKKRNIEFQLQGEPHIRLHADKEAFGRVAENLFSNALKYSPRGKGPILVEFKAAGDWLVMAVEDKGIGIPRKQQERLFEEFFRATNARNQEKFGTGLGLSIVKQILQGHGGKVTVASEPKKGTRFETWWPYSPAGIKTDTSA